MEEMEDYENGSSSKRIKLEKNCVLCGKDAYFTEKEEEYTVLLINYLVSPFDRGVFIKEDKLSCFEFCLGCGDVLEDLVQLKQSLQAITDNIKEKITEIKFSILRNFEVCCSSEEGKRFQTLATKDMCPVVGLDINNILCKKKPNFEDFGSSYKETFCNMKIRSQLIKIESQSNEYFDEEEEIEQFEPWDEQTVEYQGNNCAESSHTIFPSENSSSSISNSFCEYGNSLNNSETKEWNIKPKLKYSQLAIIAIANSKDVSATLHEIHNFILMNFPYFRNNAPFKPYLIRALNSNPFEAENSVRICDASKARLTLTGINKSVIEEIATLLKSSQVLQTMAFPEHQNLYIKKLWDVLRAELPEKNHRVNSTMETMNQSAEPMAENNQAAESQWRRPPFPLSQIVFIALSNCAEKRAKEDEIVESIRNTFPFFLANNPVKTWKQCLNTTLLINKCFIRAVITRFHDPANDVWTINENKAESIRNKIKEILENEKLSFSSYIANPEVSLRNAFYRPPDGSVLKNTNQNLNAATNISTSEMPSEQLTTTLNEVSNQAQSGSSSTVHSSPGRLEINENKWQRPPLNFAQIIFLALSSCPDRKGNASEIISKIREIFPYTICLPEKWAKGASTVLFYNENFIRTNAGENETPNSTHIWTVNDVTADKIRKEIKQVLGKNCLTQSNCMKKPAEVLKSALIFDYSPHELDKNGKTDKANSSNENSKPNLVLNGRNGWLRPPFNFVQIVFIALSNCPGKLGNTVAIIARIRALFPWLLNENIDFTWIKALTTILFTNDNFVRKSEAGKVPPLKSQWTIDEKFAYRIRNEIRSIVKSAGLTSLCHYVMHPEETLRKALTTDTSLANDVGNSCNVTIPEMEIEQSSTLETTGECVINTMSECEETTTIAESVIIKQEVEIEEEFTGEESYNYNPVMPNPISVIKVESISQATHDNPMLVPTQISVTEEESIRETTYNNPISVPTSVVEEESTLETTYNYPIASTPISIVEEKDCNKTWSAPPFNMQSLAAFFLANSKEMSLTSFSICDSITKYFPYFKQYRKSLSSGVLSSLRNKKYFIQSCCDDDKTLRRFSLNTQNEEAFTKLKAEMYKVFKEYYKETYKSFSKPSELYPMLKNILGNDFDLSFLQSITVYRQVDSCSF